MGALLNYTWEDCNADQKAKHEILMRRANLNFEDTKAVLLYISLLQGTTDSKAWEKNLGELSREPNYFDKHVATWRGAGKPRPYGTPVDTDPGAAAASQVPGGGGFASLQTSGITSVVGGILTPAPAPPVMQPTATQAPASAVPPPAPAVVQAPDSQVRPTPVPVQAYTAPPVSTPPFVPAPDLGNVLNNTKQIKSQTIPYLLIGGGVVAAILIFFLLRN